MAQRKTAYNTGFMPTESRPDSGGGLSTQPGAGGAPTNMQVESGPMDFGSYSSPGYGGPMSPTFKLDGNPLSFYNPEDFKMPTADEAWQDPGFQFRLGSGQQALERSAAARGLLRSGGTLKDLVQYGQNFGAQEYQNVFNRALQGYQQNAQNKWNKAQLAADVYKTKAGLEAQRGMAEFNRYWDVHQGRVAGSQYQDSRMIDLLSQAAGL